MHGRPTRPAPAPEKSDIARYYEILDVSTDATKEELKRAWRRAAKKFHPDKGGDTEKFNFLRQAYDVLSDPHKRRIYDQCIEHALPGRCEVSHVAIGCGRRRWRQLKLGKDVTHPLSVSHEELQTGTTKLFHLSHNIICSKCKGKGSKSGVSVLVTCANCRGLGKKVSIERLMGKSWRVSYRCKECRGAGENIDPMDRCPQCKGDKVVQERKVLEVHVEKGMKNGQRIIFPEAADEAPGIITGDVVFVLQIFDLKKPFLLDSEDNSEDSEETSSVFEEDSEEILSVYEEDSEQDSEEQRSCYSEEDMEEDYEENSDVDFFLQQLFKEDCEQDSDIGSEAE